MSNPTAQVTQSADPNSNNQDSLDETNQAKDLFKGFGLAQGEFEWKTPSNQRELDEMAEQEDLSVVLNFDASLTLIKAKRLAIRSDCELHGRVSADHLTICGKSNTCKLLMSPRYLHVENSYAMQTFVSIGFETVKRDFQVIEVPNSVEHLSIRNCPQMDYIVFGYIGHCKSLELSGDSTEPWNLSVVGLPFIKLARIGVSLKTPIPLGYALHVNIFYRELKKLSDGQDLTILNKNLLDKIIFYSQCKVILSIPNAFLVGVCPKIRDRVILVIE